jgi:hypothetical protein
MIKKSYIMLLLVTLTFNSNSVLAQTDEAAVKQTVNNLFAGMKRTDTALIRLAFSDACVLQTVIKNKEGKIVILTEPLDSFIVTIGHPHPEIYDERITFDVVRIDGDLAMVWAPYKFYLGDKLSHCGVDSFQLVKINGDWKIQYLVDTRRRQNCD